MVDYNDWLICWVKCLCLLMIVFYWLFWLIFMIMFDSYEDCLFFIMMFCLFIMTIFNGCFACLWWLITLNVYNNCIWWLFFVIVHTHKCFDCLILYWLFIITYLSSFLAYLSLIFLIFQSFCIGFISDLVLNIFCFGLAVYFFFFYFSLNCSLNWSILNFRNRTKSSRKSKRLGLLPIIFILLFLPFQLPIYKWFFVKDFDGNNIIYIHKEEFSQETPISK